LSFFFYFHMGIWFSLHHLLKTLSFPCCVIWCPCQGLVYGICLNLPLGSLFCSTGLCCLLCEHKAILNSIPCFIQGIYWLHRTT
jgi:hypothetical protein